MRKSNFLICFIAIMLSLTACAQRQVNALDRVSHSSSLKFVERDGSCIDGRVSKTDATGVTVHSSANVPITVAKDNLLHVSQGVALLYSARSSWADVVASASVIDRREVFVLKLKNGKRVKGRPKKTSSDGITLKHGFSTTLYPKSEIATVDYLRLKPPTDGFIFVLQEDPFLSLFDPEFYYRTAGLEGRVKVHLYDATKPEDNSPVGCKGRP